MQLKKLDDQNGSVLIAVLLVIVIIGITAVGYSTYQSSSQKAVNDGRELKRDVEDQYAEREWCPTNPDMQTACIKATQNPSPGVYEEMK